MSLCNYMCFNTALKNVVKMYKYISFHLNNVIFNFKNCIGLKEIFKMYKDIFFHPTNCIC